jgi:hypothetical protein
LSPQPVLLGLKKETERSAKLAGWTTRRRSSVGSATVKGGQWVGKTKLYLLIIMASVYTLALALFLILTHGH